MDASLNGSDAEQNKMMFIATGIVVLILISAFFFMKKSPAQSPTPTAPAQNETQPTESAGSTSGSLLDLIGMGKTIQCDFNYSTETQTTTKGTVYISGGKVRGDFDTTANGKTSTMHMIRDADYSHMWGSAMPQGIKMKNIIPPTGAAGTTGNSQPAQYFDAERKADYQCKPWAVDQSLFTVPADVTFQDLSAMMKGAVGAGVTGAVGAGGTQNMKAAQCAACAQLQGDAKATCEKQLGC